MSAGAKFVTAVAIAGGVWLALREPSAEVMQQGFHDRAFGRKRRRKGLGVLPISSRLSTAMVERALARLGSQARACGITAKNLREGMEVEREHRDVTHGSEIKTARIAAAHLCERKDYYKLLKQYVEG